MEKHLKTKYGYTKFRPYQKNIIQDILNGENVTVIFPTGGGKSLCYQFPATYTKKISIVISPLISLMTDQQINLQSSGITSICLNSTTYTPQKSLLNRNHSNPTIKKLNNLTEGAIVYITPEFFANNITLFKPLINKIVLFAIDEAHCLSSWGHDFRKSYRSLSLINQKFPSIPIASFTATATPAVLDDIFNTLGIDDANEYCVGFRRPNLSISVKQKSDNIFFDLDINPDESTIIYTSTRKDAEKISKLLKSYHIPSGCYHGGMTIEKRTSTHNKFITDKIKIIVATVSFGMGIDKSDIRKVINYGAPANLETYYQEIGRAGRDGLPSKVVLFYKDSDFSTILFLISQSEKREHKHSIMNIFRKYITNHTHCRQTLIEYYFENGKLPQNIPNINKCGKCDNCTDQKDPNQNTIEIITDAKFIIGLVSSLPVNYGITKLIGVLRGSRASNIKSLINNPFYNKCPHYTIKELKYIIDILISKEYLDRKIFGKNTVITQGPNTLSNSLKIYMKHPTIKPPSKKDYSTTIRILRNTLAHKHKVAPYMFLDEKTLQKIATIKPTTIIDLAFIDGVNEHFIKNYGSSFLYKTPISKKPSDTNLESYTLYKSGKTIQEIMNIRSRAQTTIEQHIINIWKNKPEEIDLKRSGITPQIRQEIGKAIQKVGKDKLKPIKDMIPRYISYFQIKVCILL